MGRIGIAGARRLEIVAGHCVKGQFAAFYKPHQYSRQFRVEGTPLNQKTQHRAVGDRHRYYGAVGLGKHGVLGDGRCEPGGIERVADGYGKSALDGLGGVRVAAGLSPGQFLLHAPSPGLTDGLTGVTAGSACRCAVEKRKEFFIHPAAKVFFVVAAAIDEGTNHQLKDEAGLGQLSAFESGMVSLKEVNPGTS